MLCVVQLPCTSVLVFFRKRATPQKKNSCLVCVSLEHVRCVASHRSYVTANTSPRTSHEVSRNSTTTADNQPLAKDVGASQGDDGPQLQRTLRGSAYTLHSVSVPLCGPLAVSCRVESFSVKRRCTSIQLPTFRNRLWPFWTREMSKATRQDRSQFDQAADHTEDQFEAEDCEQCMCFQWPLVQQLQVVRFLNSTDSHGPCLASHNLFSRCEDLERPHVFRQFSRLRVSVSQPVSVSNLKCTLCSVRTTSVSVDANASCSVSVGVSVIVRVSVKKTCWN